MIVSSRLFAIFLVAKSRARRKKALRFLCEGRQNQCEKARTWKNFRERAGKEAKRVGKAQRKNWKRAHAESAHWRAKEAYFFR